MSDGGSQSNAGLTDLGMENSHEEGAFACDLSGPCGCSVDSDVNFTIQETHFREVASLERKCLRSRGSLTVIFGTSGVDSWANNSSESDRDEC
jgi:hypothetical protein